MLGLPSSNRATTLNLRHITSDPGCLPAQTCSLQGRDSGLAPSSALVFDVLPNDLDRRSAAAHDEVARAPQVVAPDLDQVGEGLAIAKDALSSELAAAHTGQGIDFDLSHLMG